MPRSETPPIETDLRQAVLTPLREQNAVRKAELTLALSETSDVATQASIADPGDIPGRPAQPVLVSHTSLKA